MKKFNQKRLSLLLEILLFLVIVAAGVFYVRYTWIRFENKESEQVLQIGKSIVAALPMDDLRQLEAQGGDLDKPQYRRVKNTLKEIIRVNDKARFAYLYTQRNGKIYFFADSEPENSPDYSYPGQEYTESEAAYKIPFKNGDALITGPVNDRWGRWQSVLIPVKDEVTGKIIAIFGIDFNIDRWNSFLLFEVIESCIIIVVLMLLLYFSIRIIAKNKLLKNEISRRISSEVEVEKEKLQYKKLLMTIPDIILYKDNDGKLQVAIEKEKSVLKGLLNSIPDIIFFKNMDGVFLGCNPAFEQLTGRDISQIINKTDYDLVPAEVADNFRKNDNITMEEGKTRHNDEWLTYPDGTRKLFDTCKTPLKNSYGEIIGLLGISRDITERKRMSDLLHESEQNFRTFFETINDLIFIGTSSGEVLHINSAVTKILGYTLEEVKALGILGVHPPEKQQEASEIFSGMFKGEIDYCPLPLQSKSGALIPVETRVWFGKWNGQDCIFGISKDLSVQQAALEKFQKLFDNNPAPMAISAIPGREFIHVNKEFLNKLKYSYTDIIGHTAEDLNLFVDSEKQIYFADELLHSGRLHNLELLVRTKSNEILTGLFAGDVIDNQLEKIYLTVMTDITPQKMAEEKIRNQKEQLEQLNAEKDKFYSIISHDLRNPFQTILGYTQLMADDWPTLKQDDLHKIVLMLRNSAINLHRLLENLLEWSHLHQGVTTFSIESFFLTPKIKECIELFNDPLTKKNIELINDIPTDLKVNADIHMFETVFRNLLSNAIKFTPRGGKIILTALERPGHLAEIAISDTGIGMDETLIGNLFRLDTKTNRKGTEKEPSTGLGLIICKEFIEKHGGKLYIDSKEGVGSRFYFTLPLS